MGVYDMIEGECPWCHQQFDAQTKMGDCGMELWTVGSRTTLPDMNLELKNDCYNCKKPVVAVIRGGVLESLVTGPAGLAEGPGGSVKRIGPRE